MNLQISGRLLLDKTYSLLEGHQEDIVMASAEAPSDLTDRERWPEIGDWSSLAARLGAEKVLFVQNDPVFVFSELGGRVDDQAIHDAYRRAWCMSGPFCLFLALPDSLHVYALNEPPSHDANRELTPFKIFKRLEDVEAALGESGSADMIDLISANKNSAVQYGRADVRLIRDLQYVRQSLISSGMAVDQAHSLIGRSILIRYLEDRNVIGAEYFKRIAAANPEWTKILQQPLEKPAVARLQRNRLYDRVLLNPDFTQELFSRLAADFNGDLFSIGAGGDAFKAEHLLLMRQFLLGDTDPNQPALFFWAYDFEVVPLSLISSIYEEFYHASSEGDGGENVLDDNTHFTPLTLVQDVLSRLLPPAVLENSPRIIDPACGSGIFLVEAFKRIVRFEITRRGRKLDSNELRHILRHQICGIEIQPEAARVAAFSLYLALLDSQEPPDILTAGKMPHLIHIGQRDDDHYGVVVAGNAFALTSSERDRLVSHDQLARRYKGRANVQELMSHPPLDLEVHSFDVVVGNPPWQEATDFIIDEDGEKKPLKKGGPARQALLWAEFFGYPVGDKSYSQLFLYRSLTFLKKDGACGLLVSAKVLWNARETSKSFRNAFLSLVNIREVVNFTHVRRVFFAGAVAPFVFLRFEPRSEGTPSSVVTYWNARRGKLVEATGAIGLTVMERRLVRQADLEAVDYLWKTYWWGSHRDASLVSRLGMERSIGEYLDREYCEPGYGWQRGGSAPEGDLAVLPELETTNLKPFGPLSSDWLRPPPTGVKRQPDERLYQGLRLITKRGVSEPHGPICRLEDRKFSFRHTVYCVPLHGWSVRDARIALGVLWSSLGRYRLFMTSGNWGGWHDQVTSEDILSTPIRIHPSWGMPSDAFNDAVQRIVDSVEFLRHSENLQPDVLHDEAAAQEKKEAFAVAQVRLNEAVFDLFELSVPERELVNDFWEMNHSLFWKGSDAEGVRPIVRPAKVQGLTDNLSDLPAEFKNYIGAFVEALTQRSGQHRKWWWSIGGSDRFDVVALEFRPIDQKNPSQITTVETAAWEEVLTHRSLSKQLGSARSAFLAGKAIRVSSDKGFIIAKENERRNWSATVGREDAEAVSLHFLKAG